MVEEVMAMMAAEMAMVMEEEMVVVEDVIENILNFAY
jgi:hypothetical protein